VRKLHALACVLESAEGREGWMQALDRPVPRLEVVELPAGTRHVDAWAQQNGQDAAQLRRLNPVFTDGRIRPGDSPVRLLTLATAPAPAPASIASPLPGVGTAEGAPGGD